MRDPYRENYIDLEREKIRIFGIEETIDFQPTNIEKQGRIFHHKILRKILRWPATLENPRKRNDSYFVNLRGRFLKLPSDVNIAIVSYPVPPIENYFRCHPMSGKFYNGDVQN